MAKLSGSVLAQAGRTEDEEIKAFYRAGQEATEGLEGNELAENIERLDLTQILSHTMSFYLCQEGAQCSSPLRFSELLSD
jgi:hypothetical protein